MEVALVGLACRLPDAPDVGTFWRNQLEARVSFQALERQRWDHHSFYDANPRARDRTHSRRAALLPSVSSFAARAFGISPRRAQVMDPQQRLALEVACEAWQDAGLETRPVDQRRSAVFLGANLSEYGALMASGLRARQMSAGEFGSSLAHASAEQATDRVSPLRSYSLPGSTLSMCASNLAQRLGLQGPAVVLEAACAAGAAAMVQAASYLAGLPPTPEGEPAPVALTGGVYLLLLPDNLVAFSKIGALAADGCHPFDARAAGFLMGEGACLIVFKRLADAVRDGDRIYAVLRGAAWGNDGDSGGPMTPSVEGQQRVVGDALAQAGFEPDSLDYVECHGTGTVVGDRVELTALSSVVGASRPRIGSAKANIGHTLAASGAVGLARVALALHRGRLPPQAGWETWHPDLSEARSRLIIDTASSPWAGARRRALVNSFGFGGTNVCLALEQPPAQRSGDGPALFLCSAGSRELLESYRRALAESLDEDPLEACAYTVTARRRPGEWAALFVARNRQEARDALQGAAPVIEGPTGELHTLVDGSGDPLLAQAARAAGDPARLEALFPAEARRLATLPPTPVAREEYWFTR